MAWLPGYTYCLAIYANTTGLGTLTNFPLVVFPPDMTGKVLANFNDARFTDTDGTTLLKWTWEIKSAAAAVAHVKIPTMTGANSHLLIGYLYYGYAGGDPGDASDHENVWVSDWTGVWHLNEASGILYDDTAHNDDGTSAGSPTYGVTAKIGKGMTFNGSTQYIDAGSAFPTGSFSVSAWINLATSPPDWTGFIGIDNTLTGGAGLFYIQKRSSSKYEFVVVADGIDTHAYSDANAATGVWQHMVCTYNNSDRLMYMYINGVQQLVPVYAGAVRSTSTGTLIIGGLYYGDVRTSLWKGSLDEVRLYNGVLSQDQITADYKAGAGTILSFEDTPLIDASYIQYNNSRLEIYAMNNLMQSFSDAVYQKPYKLGGTKWLPRGQKPLLHQKVDWDAWNMPSPVGEWWMNEGSGNWVNDSSGNGNTGKLTNGPLWVPTPQGGGLSLDGSDDYILTQVGYPTTVGSVALWFTLNVNSRFLVDFRHPSTGTGWINTTGASVGVSSGTSYIDGMLGNNASPLGTWHRLVVSGIAFTAPVCVFIGARYGPTDGFYLSGVIAACHIFPAALTASQVAALEGGVPIWRPPKYFFMSSMPLRSHYIQYSPDNTRIEICANNSLIQSISGV